MSLEERVAALEERVRGLREAIDFRDRVLVVVVSLGGLFLTAVGLLIR